MKWLREGDKGRTKKELERLLGYWQDKLGMRDWAFRIDRVKTMNEAGFLPESERFGILRCSCERDLIHELLHALFYRRNWAIDQHLDSYETALRAHGKGKKSFLIEGADKGVVGMLQEVYIFQLTNALLRLKYGDSR